MPTDGAAVPSVASILVVFFVFGVATILLLWLMDTLVDALRLRILERRQAYQTARQGTMTGSDSADDVPEGSEDGPRRSWWRRLFEERSR